MIAKFAIFFAFYVQPQGTFKTRNATFSFLYMYSISVAVNNKHV